MLKIALIVPKGSKYGKNKYLKNFLAENDTVYRFYGAWETPNLSLLTVAGMIIDKADMVFIDEDHGQVIDFSKSYDIVALTAMTQQAYRAYEIADCFRKNGTYVVMGGIHVSIMPEEGLKHVDTVFIGEGETLWGRFISDYLKGKCKKIYKAKEYCSLSLSPCPAYYLTDKSLYTSYSIQITRGCPRSCNYCTLPIMYGNTYRHKTVDQVLREIKSVQAVNPNAFIFFADDNMFIDKAFVKELLTKIERMGISWGTQTDISVAHDDYLLKQIYNAGCHWLFIGFENVTIKGLQFLDEKEWKARQLSVYEPLIERIHRRGIQIWGSFMFGGDSDDEHVFENTLNFTIKNNIYSGSFTILTPLPGTEMFEYMHRNNRIIDYDWSRYTFWDVVFKPKNMTPDTLAQGVAYVYENFYSDENVKSRTSRIKKRMRESLYGKKNSTLQNDN